MKIRKIRHRSSTIAKVGMKPPHPGAFIREEILEPHGLNVSDADEFNRVLIEFLAK